MFHLPIAASNLDLRCPNSKRQPAKKSERCHGLVPWSITLVATPPIEPACLDATGLSRGVLRSLLHHRSNPPVWMPRACPVEYYARCYTTDRTRLSGCHGLVPWSLTFVAK